VAGGWFRHTDDGRSIENPGVVVATTEWGAGSLMRRDAGGAVVVFSATVVGVVAWLQGYGPLRGGGPAAVSTPLACLVAILAIRLAVGASLADLGYRFPERVSAVSLGFAVGTLAIGTPIALHVMRWPSYASFYDHLRFVDTMPSARIARFAATLLSITIPVDVVFRGALLFGLRNAILSRRVSSPDVWAALVVAGLEIGLHAPKPPTEIAAVALASPVFSWLSLRTRSVLPAIAIHSYVEVLFVAAVLT
jgi:membrane protease YdiL (CAAX protease family)